MVNSFCRLRVNAFEKLEFVAPMNSGRTLEEQIKEDEKYGKMRPRNGHYFTYRAENWQGELITSKQVQRAVTLVWESIEKKILIDVRKAVGDEIPDFRVVFSSTANHEQLDKNTLQLHYFPINDLDSPLRGLCVVNTDFPITIDGEPLDLHVLDPNNYPEPTNLKGKTYDFDAIYTHEGPGHGLGLPHSKNAHVKMSDNYMRMAEFVEDEDPKETVPRLEAKYGKRPMLSHHRKRWEQWKRHRHDNY